MPVPAAIDDLFAGAGESWHDLLDERFGHESVSVAADYDNGPGVVAGGRGVGYSVVPDIDVACHDGR